MNAESLRRALIALTVGASISSLSAAPPPAKDVPVTSIVLDYAADVAPALTIRSDGAGSYLNSKTLTSLIQGIGDWVLDAINPRNATRRIYLDFSQAVPGSGPGLSPPSFRRTSTHSVRLHNAAPMATASSVSPPVRSRHARCGSPLMPGRHAMRSS